MPTLEERLHDLILHEWFPRFSATPANVRPDPEWAKLRATGTRLWLDTGDLAAAAGLWSAEFEALTTNNTLLNAEVQKGTYDALVRDIDTRLRSEAPACDARRRVLETVFALNAIHGLRLVRTFGASVSVELHTDLAHDVERSVAHGRRYHAICPERFIVKIPMTPAGFVAARRLGQAGVPVNFTLGFSARQNHLAARFARPSFVNVFMGRLGVFVAERGLGDGRGVGEKATLACQRDLVRLRAGGEGTRLIGASMRDGGQVAALAGLDVFTMPPKVAAQYRAAPAAAPVPFGADEPHVTLAAGVLPADLGAPTLWEIPPAFAGAVEDLVRRSLDTVEPADLQDHFERAGLPGLLPRWSPSELAEIARDGKIPEFGKWRACLASGRIGLDALMNAAGLMSFVADQKALDDRIRSLTAG